MTKNLFNIIIFDKSVLHFFLPKNVMIELDKMWGEIIMIISCPEWFKVEKDTLKIISYLTSIKELSFYLRSPDPFIRRLAILRVGALQLKEGIGFLTEMVENHSELETNRELSAWALKTISFKYDENLYVNNRLLTHYTGEETLEEVSRCIKINMPNYDLSYEFIIPENNTIDIIKNYVEFNNDFVIEDPFQWTNWFYSLHIAVNQKLKDTRLAIKTFPRKVMSGIGVLWIYLIKLFTSKNDDLRSKVKIKKITNHPKKKSKSHLSKRFQISMGKKVKSLALIVLHLGKNVLFFIIYPLRLIKMHKAVTSLIVISFFMLSLNVPWLSGSIEEHTNIKTSRINHFIHNISSQFLTMISEGASDLLNTQNNNINTSESNLHNKVTDLSPQSFYKVTAKSGLVLRSQPSAPNSEVLSSIEYNTKVVYLETSEKDQQGRIWFLVKTPDGKVGWAYSNWLKEWRE